MSQFHSSFQRAPRRGFTLVELMLSIAMVLLLMIGINAIFRTTADTVGTGQAALSTARELRNAFDAFDSDFNGFLGNGSQPVLIIYNQNLPGFRDKVDMNSDKDYLTTNSNENALHVFDSQGNILTSARIGGFNNGNMPVVADNRNHRVDIVSFFSSGRFRRQTGMQKNLSTNAPDFNTYQSLYNSDTAYISFGHARLPDNNSANWLTPGTYLHPGLTGGSATNNPNGFFANEWIVTRRAIMLGKPDTTNNNYILGLNGSGGNSPQGYFNPAFPNNNPNQLQKMIPFAYGTAATFGNSGMPAPNQIQDSTCDVAGISLSDYTARVKSNSLTGAGKRYPLWYLALLSSTGATNGNGTTPASTFRYACKPWVSRNFATPQDRQVDFGLSSPAFIHGCSQFIVEFAGDYVEQKTPNSDAITGVKADNTLDFDMIAVPDRSGTNTVLEKRIRWYGLERRYASNTQANPAGPYYLDVRPLYKWTGVPLPFEKVTTSGGAADSFPRTLPAQVGSYTCAWNAFDLQHQPAPGDDPNLLPASVGPYAKGFMPWMIRVTIRVDDPAGRLPDGQVVQYVFNLPH